MREEIFIVFKLTLFPLNWLYLYPFTSNSLFNVFALHFVLQLIKKVLSSLLQQYIVITFPSSIDFNVIHYGRKLRIVRISHTTTGTSALSNSLVGVP
jgi:hypothetical protein